MEHFLAVFLKGAWIGGTLTVPGVSGGSMAMILGVYERLIRSVNGLFGHGGNKKESLRFLLSFSLGALSGILALSGVVVWLLERFPVPVVFFFAGAVAGGIPVIMREIKSTVFKGYFILYFLGGILLVILLSYIPTGLFSIGESGFLWQIFGGLIASAALVLPGISVSHMLYVLGIYEGLMESISHLELLKILPFAIGAAAGIFLMTKAVEYLLDHFKVATYLIILGFVVGSVFELFSGIRFSDISVICFLLFATGFSGIFLLFKNSEAGA